MFQKVLTSLWRGFAEVDAGVDYQETLLPLTYFGNPRGGSEIPSVLHKLLYQHGTLVQDCAAILSYIFF